MEKNTEDDRRVSFVDPELSNLRALITDPDGNVRPGAARGLAAFSQIVLLQQVAPLAVEGLRLGVMSVAELSNEARVGLQAAGQEAVTAFTDIAGLLTGSLVVGTLAVGIAREALNVSMEHITGEQPSEPLPMSSQIIRTTASTVLGLTTASLRGLARFGQRHLSDLLFRGPRVSLDQFQDMMRDFEDVRRRRAEFGLETPDVDFVLPAVALRPGEIMRRSDFRLFEHRLENLRVDETGRTLEEQRAHLERQHQEARQRLRQLTSLRPESHTQRPIRVQVLSDFIQGLEMKLVSLPSVAQMTLDAERETQIVTDSIDSQPPPRNVDPQGSAVLPRRQPPIEGGPSPGPGGPEGGDAGEGSGGGEPPERPLLRPRQDPPPVDRRVPTIQDEDNSIPPRRRLRETGRPDVLRKPLDIPEFPPIQPIPPSPRPSSRVVPPPSPPSEPQRVVRPAPVNRPTTGMLRPRNRQTEISAAPSVAAAGRDVNIRFKRQRSG